MAAGVALWRAGSDEGGAQFTFRDGRYVDTTVPWRVTVSDRIDGGYGSTGGFDSNAFRAPEEKQ